jgi:hypothetical protein
VARAPHDAGEDGPRGVVASEPSLPEVDVVRAPAVTENLALSRTSVSSGIKSVAYLDHTGSIVADEGLDILGVSHFLPTAKLGRCHICYNKQKLRKQIYKLDTDR